MKPKLYISGPITLGDRDANVSRAKYAALVAMQRGWSVLCPHLSCYYEWGEQFSHSEWLKQDLPWLMHADALVRLPGESLGADEEVFFANDHHIKVYFGLENLPHATPQNSEPQCERAQREDRSSETVRRFASGATRNVDDNKPDYEGFLSPLAIEAFGRYMHEHRKQSDGKLRASDNWQKGIPRDVYMKSAFRHFVDLWSMHRGGERRSPEDNHVLTKEEVCSALLFNIQGYLHESIKASMKSDGRIESDC